MNENPRHVISRALDEHCDRLHPEQARIIVAALNKHGYAIVPKEPNSDMVIAGGYELQEHCGVTMEPAAKAYAAMVRAAAESEHHK